MEKKQVDALIIGFGKGGKTLAPFLAKQGLKVAVVEKSSAMYGGTCINIACIPTKSLVHASELASASKSASYAERDRLFKQAILDKNELVGFLRQKNFNNLNQAPGVEVITGRAVFLSPNEVQVDLADGGELVFSADKIFIDTGAVPFIPDIPGLGESSRVYTSTTLMELTDLPKRLVIVGSGYIGLEFASIFAGFGTEVTILERGGVFLPREDRDIAAEVQKVLEARGIEFRFHASVQYIEDEGNHTVLRVKTADQEVELEAEAVLVATGRTPNTAQLGLDRAGVEVTEKGFVQVDDTLRTNVPHIWAIGDVNGGPQFTYISLDDYRIIRDQLYGSQTRTRKDRLNVPYSVFITPILARVGFSEEEAVKQGYNIKTAKFPVAGSPRARLLKATDGILKAVVDADNGSILGVTLFSVDAGEVINLVALAMENKQPYTALRDRIFTHPSMSEALNDLFSLID